MVVERPFRLEIPSLALEVLQLGPIYQVHCTAWIAGISGI